MNVVVSAPNVGWISGARARLGVLLLQSLDLLVGRDRRDRDVAHVPVDVERSAGGLGLDAPVAVVVAGPRIAVGVAVAEAVRAGAQIGVIAPGVRIAVDRRRVCLVRAQRHALAIRVARGRLVLPGADGRIVVGVVARQQDAGRIRRLPLQLAANRHGIALVVVGRDRRTGSRSSRRACPSRRTGARRACRRSARRSPLPP